MQKLIHVEKPLVALLIGLLPLPWWWVVPSLLGLLGGAPAGLAIAPALQVLTWPFLAITVVMLSRCWYLEWASWKKWRRSAWSRWSFKILIASTVLAGSIWAFRLDDVFGTRPFWARKVL